MSERLLGRDGPDIGCQGCFDRLDEYVDAELSGADADERVPGMRVHLDGCPACLEEYEALRELAAAEGPAR